MDAMGNTQLDTVIKWLLSNHDGDDVMFMLIDTMDIVLNHMVKQSITDISSEEAIKYKMDKLNAYLSLMPILVKREVE